MSPSGHFVVTASQLALSALVLCAIAILPGCGKKGTELGGGSSEVTGSAGPAGAQGENKSLVKCAAPVATLALVENPNGDMMGSYGLPSSPVPAPSACPWCVCWRSKAVAFEWWTAQRA